MSPASSEDDRATREACGGSGMVESPRRILVVEDEFLIACLIHDQLAELGYGVVGPALKMGQARRLAKTAVIDAALLDWDMEGEAATELAEDLFERRIPVMVVTGYVEIPNGGFLNLPILRKPFGLDDLRAAIDALLRRAPSRAAGDGGQESWR